MDERFQLRKLWRADYEKPMRTGHKQGEIQLNCFFLKIFICGLRLTALAIRGRCRTAASPKLFTFREAGMLVSPVTISLPSPRTTDPPCFTTGYKRLTEGGHWVLLFGFLMGKAFGFRVSGFWLLGFWAFGFLVWEAFGRENC
jgi:hypothetical protein